jgi:hypothetical protein
VADGRSGPGTAAQQRWRAEFARRVKSGEFKRGAGRPKSSKNASKRGSRQARKTAEVAVKSSRDHMARKVAQARKLYEKFTGDEASAVGSVEVSDTPKVGVLIGQIDGVLYTTVREGVTEKYIHKFKKSARPMFVVSPDGKQLFMVGGRYDFTERGIVDKED